MKKLARFERLWDGHVEEMNSGYNRTDLFPADMEPIHYALYLPGPNAGKNEKFEKSNMLKQQVIEQAKTHSEPPALFTP